MAVLVGCNYPKTKNELHGCINDVVAMRDVLINRFGFQPAHVQLLTDAPGSSSSPPLVMPTGANIKKALDQMVDEAQPGDVLYFHYSGHGTRIPSLKPGHPFRQDEAIVPCDFNLITGFLLFFICLFILFVQFIGCYFYMEKLSPAIYRYGLPATSEPATKGNELHNSIRFMPQWRSH